MLLGVLGPLVVWNPDGAPVDLAGRQPRTLLAALAAAAGRPVSADAAIEAIWGDVPPASAVSTLQSYVSRLRRALPDGLALTWSDPGYQLDAEPEAVDALEFARLASAGRDALAAGDVAAALDALTAAEGLWRGPAYAEFADRDAVAGAAVRLDEQRLVATEDRMRCELALGRPDVVVATLAELRREHPLRERFHELHALALYRCGRQAEALRALDEARSTLRDELGLDPGRELRELETAILAQDPSLDRSPEERSSGPAVTAGSGMDAAPATDGDLVGRDHELSLLLEALAASADESRCVVIEGEPGIGKTRLADEVLAAAAGRGLRIVRGRSDESGAAPALWPWLQPLRSLAAEVPELHGSLAETLAGVASGSSLPADAAQFELFEAVVDLLDAVTADGAVALLLDDLQWSDPTSLGLLTHVLGRVERGLFVVATMRPPEVGRQDALTDTLAALARRPGNRRLALAGLSPEATAELVTEVAGGPVAAPLVAAISERAEGNPFYAIELARLLESSGSGALEVPATVADVIRRRLAALPEGTVELLTVGAVAGRDLDVELLSLAGDRPLEEVLDALDVALAHRMLMDSVDHPGQLRFVHALIREVLLDGLTSLGRARLHLRVADALEQRGVGPDDAERLALHLYRATPAAPVRRAAEALEAAAEVAVNRVAYAAAEDLLTKAVSLRRAAGSGPADQEAELNAALRLLEVARAVRYFSGAASFGEIDRAKDLARRLGRDDVLHQLLWFELAAYLTAARVREAEPLARAFLEITDRSGDPWAQAAAHETWAVWCWGMGRIAEGVESADRSAELIALASPPVNALGAELRVVIQCFWAYEHLLHGDIPTEELFAVVDEQLAAETDRVMAVARCGFAGSMAVVVGDWGRVDRYSHTGLAVDEHGQFGFWYGQIQMHRAVFLAHRGELEEAAALWERGLAGYSGVGGYSGVIPMESAFADGLLRHGRIDDARAHLRSARADLDRLEERWGEPLLLMAEALLAAAEGDAELAGTRFDEVEDLVRRQESFGYADRLADARARASAG